MDWFRGGVMLVDGPGDTGTDDVCPDVGPGVIVTVVTGSTVGILAL